MIVANTIAQWFSCHPHALLLLVMIGCPVCMNIAMLWVQDQFLMAKVETSSREQSNVRRSNGSVHQALAPLWTALHGVYGTAHAAL